MNFEKIWLNILAHQNKTFKTKKGKEFSYVVKDQNVVVHLKESGTEHTICRTYIDKALQLENSELDILRKCGVQRSTYVYGIITDERIKNL